MMKNTRLLSILLALLLVLSGCGAGDIADPGTVPGPASDEGPAEGVNAPPAPDESRTTAADIDEGLMPYVGVWERGDGLVRIRVNGDHSWEKYDEESGETDGGAALLFSDHLDLADADDFIWNTVMLTGDGGLTDDNGDVYHLSGEDIPSFTEEANAQVPGEEPASGRPVYQPVFDGPYDGNFIDIDPEVFANSDYAPEQLVGRWYEDGWTNGYYLELYGDGTWRFFGEKTESGRYSISYSTISLEQGYYGVDLGQLFPYGYDDGSRFLSLGAFSWKGDFIARTPVDPRFRPESQSKPCDDLEAFYADRYPSAWLEGTWYPVEDDGERIWYDINGEGRWGEARNGSVTEIGKVELTGPGICESEGANFGGVRVFEYTGDGDLYIDGRLYERRVPGAADGPAPEGVVGTFLYYDSGKGDYSDRGYEFRSDWTFRSLPDPPREEEGTFIFLGDNLLLYDDDGYQLHYFSQSSFDAELGCVYDRKNNEDIYRP